MDVLSGAQPAIQALRQEDEIFGDWQNLDIHMEFLVSVRTQ